MLGEWYLPPGESQVIWTITEGTISTSHAAFRPARTKIAQTSSLLADQAPPLKATVVADQDV